MKCENWKALAKKIRARATGLRRAADGCVQAAGNQHDRFALQARADEADSIAAWIEAAIGVEEEVAR